MYCMRSAIYYTQKTGIVAANPQLAEGSTKLGDKKPLKSRIV